MPVQIPIVGAVARLFPREGILDTMTAWNLGRLRVLEFSNCDRVVIIALGAFWLGNDSLLCVVCRPTLEAVGFVYLGYAHLRACRNVRINCRAESIVVCDAVVEYHQLVVVFLARRRSAHNVENERCRLADEVFDLQQLHYPDHL